MSHSDREQQVLDLVVPALEADGYAVYVQPPRDLLPEFMGGYRPDAIALGRPRNLAIEVIGDETGTQSRRQALADRFAHVPDWELRIYYARPSGEEVRPEPASRAAIEASLSRVEDLARQGHIEAGLLLGWGTLEALARTLSRKLERAQPSGRVLELLASEGFVTPSEADTLRDLARARNLIAHGALDVEVTRADLEGFVAILHTLVVELASAHHH